jgi:hypothetical protein
MSSVRKFEEPVLARASAGPLALGDVVVEKFDAEMNELTKQLRLETQEEVLKIGGVYEVESVLGRVWRRVGRGRWQGQSIQEIRHINNELLELFDAQSLDVEVGFAQEEAFLVGGKCRQRSGVEACSVLDMLQCPIISQLLLTLL